MRRLNHRTDSINHVINDWDWSLRAQVRYLPGVLAGLAVLVALGYAQAWWIGIEQW